MEITKWGHADIAMYCHMDNEVVSPLGCLEVSLVCSNHGLYADTLVTFCV